MSRKRTWIVVGAVLAVLLVAGGVVAYLQFFRDDAPPEVTLSTEGSTAPTVAGATADGVWQVGADSFAGYRVRETFAGFTSPADAVGRSTAVTGDLTVEGSEVTAADFEVDMTQLQSDTGARDTALRSRGLETDTFPTASFTLTEPVDLGGEPSQGEAVEATATGDLTLHGVTRQVEVPIEAVWSGDRIEVVGSIDIAFGDYDIEAPTTARVVSIEENGVVEFQLFFERG